MKFEVSTYDEFLKIGVTETLKSYNIVYYDNYGGINSHSKKMLELVKENLKENKIYDYSELNRAHVKIIASSKNLEKIKANTLKLEEYERENNIRCEYDEYEDILSKYRDDLEELQVENAELLEQIRELEDYKERVQDILGE